MSHVCQGGIFDPRRVNVCAIFFPLTPPLPCTVNRVVMQQAAAPSFGDHIAFNFDLYGKGKTEKSQEYGEDDDGDELDRAFPGGFTFIRDRLMAANRQVQVEPKPESAGAEASNGNYSAVAGVPAGEKGAGGEEETKSTGREVVHAAEKGGSGGGKQVGAPGSVDAGWLYSRCDGNCWSHGVLPCFACSSRS